MKLNRQHIAHLLFAQNSHVRDRLSTMVFEAIVYSAGFTWNKYRMLRNVHPDTPIEVVKGVDDICARSCPYLDQCREENYQEAAQAMQERFGPYGFLLPWCVRPTTSPKESVAVQALAIGQTYTLHDILSQSI